MFGKQRQHRSNTATRQHDNTTTRQHDNTTTSPGQDRHIAQASPRNVTAFFAFFFSALANRVGKLTLMYRPSGTWYRLPIRASGERRDRAPATGENLLPSPNT
ncbi:hypothetical protein GGR75_002651 [Xanthomonas campestris]|nr:hypothetical protein [Xanthomonas campestris]